MNKRRSSAGKRCLKCKIHHTLCFCDAITELITEARVSIIMHHRERHLTSNTANLAQLVLSKCKIHMRGHPENPFDIKTLNLGPDEVPIFLFPHEDAIDLNADFIELHKDKKIHLIVPDGTWSQAVKTYRREPGLQGIQCVKLPPGEPGRYRLRKSSDENRLSTYEAIARAMGIIEHSEKLQNEMERIFDTMVESVIRGRTAFEN
ncbi:MAG: DTW domain-containing protein [Bdellovibrionales bacterium]|nr:DTW domain-containing protein [Bdellovibrionales bacterium]